MILIQQVLTGSELVIWLSLMLVLVLSNLAILGICCWAWWWVQQIPQRLTCVFNVSDLIPLTQRRFNGFFFWWHQKCWRLSLFVFCLWILISLRVLKINKRKVCWIWYSRKHWIKKIYKKSVIISIKIGWICGIITWWLAVKYHLIFFICWFSIGLFWMPMIFIAILGKFHF